MQKNCLQCRASFEIFPEDEKFYEKIAVPAPTLCPSCRQQRRLVFRNERSLYHRKCDLCGHQLISIYSPDKPHTVYCESCWWSDKWDPFQYGQDFDFSRPFFEQFQELLLKTPLPSINMNSDNENSAYTNLSSNNKNCYLAFASSDNEDCYYSTYLQRSKNISDCFFIFDSELCHECIDCYKCYNVSFSQFVENCRDSVFLNDCRGCNNCIGCVGLVNQQYQIFNEPCTKEEFEQKRAEIFSSRAKFDEARSQFTALKEATPHKYYSGVNNENVTGDHVSFSKNASECYDCTYLEDCKYCVWMHRAKDCYDCYAFGYPGELGYENQLCGNNFYNVKFSAWCTQDISNLTYCYYCNLNSKDLFGCVGLRKKQYCILNKQYTKEEYDALVPRIIEHMGKTHEWGEFFPMSISPFAYNETVAQEYFPLTQEQVAKFGATWKNPDFTAVYQGPKIEVPFDIQHVPETIIQNVLTCETCHKNYKIIEQEYRLYRQLGIPVPANCFNCRYNARRMLRNPRVLWDRACAKCGASMQTTYAPERPEIIYCEKCYLEAVY